jgi:hypothetical protein
MPLISSTKGSGACARSSIYFNEHNDIANKLNRRAQAVGGRLETSRFVVIPSCRKKQGKQGSDMAGHRGSQWTAEEDRRLLDLIRMNKSWVLISAALSRSVKSIRDRARHLERQAKVDSAALDADRSARIGA